jgi:hypothetical protein
MYFIRIPFEGPDDGVLRLPFLIVFAPDGTVDPNDLDVVGIAAAFFQQYDLETGSVA